MGEPSKPFDDFEVIVGHRGHELDFLDTFGTFLNERIYGPLFFQVLGV